MAFSTTLQPWVMHLTCKPRLRRAFNLAIHLATKKGKKRKKQIKIEKSRTLASRCSIDTEIRCHAPSGVSQGDWSNPSVGAG